MEERYAVMERELTRTKMLIPGTTRNAISVHRTSQTDVKWKECSLAKRCGHPYGTPSGNQGKNVKAREIRDQERINVSSRRKHYNERKNGDSTSRILDDIDWTMRRNSSRNFRGDIYSIKDPINHLCRPRTLNNNSTAVCSTHNVAVILPQDSTHSTINVSRCDRNIFKVTHIVFDKISNNPRQHRIHLQINNDIQKNADKCDAAKIFENSKKSLTPFKTRQPLTPSDKTLMEACQRFDKKHESETSYFIDFDVKHKDHTQASPTVNTPKFQPIMGSEFGSHVSQRKFETDPNNDLLEKCASKKLQYFKNTDTHRKHNSQVNQTFQRNRGHWSNHLKTLPYERTRPVNDQSRNFTRNSRIQNRIPTPRSNVHTASTPMVQPFASHPALDPNGLTIQLLRLAVLLYAPALMPALNLLIARQNGLTSIPIPCSEGSNDLLTQVFRILNSQQRVPNLPYTAPSRVDECSQSGMESNSQNRCENFSRQSNADSSTESPTNNRDERISIAVNTSSESCTCNNLKHSSVQCSKSSLRERIEENQERIFA
ncbi:uncharacterized protein LOC128879959 [Hylaeus volcanicus]|uniref:uncharacterized protein LOC128879959 n=1 Tax=Hylaeus volcanicus TaxID=313075 RepID=UPI0023B7C622|nr:uncharacterized protein LOC128879959 [Hylaeus volcanicus]